MKRFIDLRGQHTGYRFAWWCTVTDTFESVAGDEAWDTWADFVDSATVARWEPADMERFHHLCPAWAFEPDPDDDFDEDNLGS